MSMGRKFRTLIDQNKYLVTPGITTPLHAKIVEKAGFKFVYVGGHDVSITLLGLADAGFLTQTEMTTNARHIASSIDIPVMVDADTGYGNAINVIRAVRDFEAAGVAAMQIEDQESPKRCGYVAGKTLVSIEEAVGKLKAAMDARKDEDFMIVGRTDAVSAVGGGLDEAIARGKAFAAAGCDMIMPIFSEPSLEQPRIFAEALRTDYPDAILYFLYASAMKWHETRVTFDDIAVLGYKAMHVSLAGLRLTMQPFWDYAIDMQERGAEAEFELEERMIGHPMADIFGFEGFPQLRELEAKYLPADAVSHKYEEIEGDT
jgi:2-methylisocitrate lyase-like PEP mutase family enzyme